MRCIFGFHYQGKYYVHFCKHGESDLHMKLLQDLQTADLSEWTEKLKNMKTTPIDQVSKFHEFENLDWKMDPALLIQELNKRFPANFSALLNSGHVVNYVNEEGKPEHDNESFIVDLDNNTFDHYVYGELKRQVPIKKNYLEKLYKEWEKAIENEEF